jgi:3',5'-cyclic AMP phosphodiesterase CpdA
MSSTASIRILHLSDLHFGPGTQSESDIKHLVTPAEPNTMRDALQFALQNLPWKPDFVVVSGDVSIGGHPDGFKQLNTLFSESPANAQLPPRTHIVLVPGNHDVARQSLTKRLPPEEQWSGFRGAFQHKFVRPPLPGDYKSPEAMMRAFVDQLSLQLDSNATVLGGIEVSALHDHVVFPFVFDREKGVLLYGFNSAAVSGGLIDLDSKTRKAFEWLGDPAAQVHEHVRTILDYVDKESQIDAAQIQTSERRLFVTLMEAIRARLPEEWERALRVGVLHHHVSNHFREESKKFESLLNAGVVKKELADLGFSLVLHGHKHDPVVLHERIPEIDWTLGVIGGATIGGRPVPGKKPGFYVIRWQQESPRLSAALCELQSFGHPVKSLENLKYHELDCGSLGQPKNQKIDVVPLREVFDRARTATISAFVDKGDVGGWSHRIEDGIASIVGTAYGLRILRRVAKPYDYPLAKKAIDHLLAVRLSDGGWCASSQIPVNEPLPTAYVLSALASWNCFETTIDILKKLPVLFPRSTPEFWDRTYAVATMLRVVASIDPSNSWIPELFAALMDGRIQNGAVVGWGKRLKANEAFSPLHTAHAVLATTECANWKDDGRLAPGLRVQLRDQLKNSAPWKDCSDTFIRPLEQGRHNSLIVNHYVLPWVVRALFRLDINPESPLVADSISSIVRDQTDGFWTAQHTATSWATSDALEALNEFSNYPFVVKYS